MRTTTIVRHLVLSVALWATYLAYWRVVLVRGVTREAPLLLLVLVLFIALQFSFTQAWIAHNRRLARRLAGRRRRRPAAPDAVRTDFVGRQLRFPEDVDLTRAGRIVVRVVGDEKRFDVEEAPVAGEAREPRA